MNKSLKIVLIAVAVVAVGSCAWFFFLKKDKAPTLLLETATVTTGDILTAVTATGTVEPLVTVEVGTQVSGEIAKVYVDYSSVVKKGQLLAELDKSTLQASLISAKASNESSKNELSYQESNFNRIKQLYETQSVSKTDYETAMYQYNTAKFSFTRSEQDLEKAQTNLGYAYIYSPIDGVVLSRAVDEGQTVAASFSTPTMFTIAKDLKQMRVIADVDEADIGSVKVGQHVTFTVDAFPEDEFTGTVTKLRLEAQVASNVVTYEVVIEAPNPKLKLLPGLTASVNIYTSERRGVLVIPAKAQRIQPTPEILAMVNKTELNEASEKTDQEGTQSAPKALSENQDMSMGKPEASMGKPGASMGKPGASMGKPGASNKKMGTSSIDPIIHTVWVQEKSGKIASRAITVGDTDGSSTEVLKGLSEGEKVVVVLSLNSDALQTSGSDQARSPFMPSRPNNTKIPNGPRQ